MELIVPLAGKDFIQADGTPKALTNLEGEPLLRKILLSRPWHFEVSGITFILLDNVNARDFAEEYLQNWFPGCKVAHLSSETQGAALSTIDGVALCADLKSPVIVDLADISYKSEIDIPSLLSNNPNCGGIALTFRSDNPRYSYLRFDSSGNFCESAEKRVISTTASAGTYVFKSVSTYLKALAYAIDNSPSYLHNGLYYLCPLFNGIAVQGLEILAQSVEDIVDIKDH